MLITLYFPSSENSDSIDVPPVAIPKSSNLRCSQAIANISHNIFESINQRKTEAKIISTNNAWEQRKLGEYVSITSGEAPSKFEVGTELYVKVDDLNYNDKYVVDTQNKVAEHSTVKRVTKGSVVFPKRGAAIMTNKVRIMGIDGYMDTNMMALTSEKLDSEFLYNIISKEGLYKIADTSTIPQINNKHVEPYEVTIPSLDEQRKIGAYFKQLDHLITLHQRKLGHVKDLKKSMLQKMFPKNGELYPEVRFPGFTAAWEQRKLGEVATFINGRAYSQDELLDEGKYKVLRVGNFYTNDSWYYSDLELPDKFYAQEGDLLYTWSATFGPHIWHGNKVIYHYHIWKVELSDKLDKTFTLQLLEEDKANILANKNGSTMVHITKEGMEQKQISIPSSVQEQAQIGAYFEQLDNLITLHQRELDHLQLLKKGMLQQMFV